MRIKLKSDLSAYRTESSLEVELNGEKVLANPGDWIVEGIGQPIVIPSNDFESYFEPLDGPNPY